MRSVPELKIAQMICVMIWRANIAVYLTPILVVKLVQSLYSK